MLKVLGTTAEKIISGVTAASGIVEGVFSTGSKFIDLGKSTISNYVDGINDENKYDKLIAKVKSRQNAIKTLVKDCHMTEEEATKLVDSEDKK